MKNETMIYAKYQGTYMNDEFIGYERAKKFINNWDSWEKCFPHEVLVWLVQKKIKMKDVCAIHYMPVSFGLNNYYEGRYERLPQIKKHFSFTEERGGWTREHVEDAYQYIIPARYQSVHLRDAFKEAIYMAYPYMGKYKFDAYVPDYSTSTQDIYITMIYKLDGEEVKTSLYCPLEALLKKDPDLIYKRHYGYNADYYRCQPERAKIVLGVLNSQKYKAFCKKVKEG